MNCNDLLQVKRDLKSEEKMCKDFLLNYCKTNNDSSNQKPYCQHLVDNYCHPCMKYLNKHPKDLKDKSCYKFLEKLCYKSKFHHYEFCLAINNYQKMECSCRLLDRTNLFAIFCTIIIIFIMMFVMNS